MITYEDLIIYENWNNALWNHFFPKGTENPIIYLDANIIKTIGEENKLGHFNTQEEWETFFLSHMLISIDNNRLANFVFNWRGLYGYACNAQNWKELVLFLLEHRFPNNRIPAYFGMLCAIMYCACTTSANHTKIKEKARIYLGENYNRTFGELIDPLFQQLHKDITSFDPERAIGIQRNISKIKYHMILNAQDRADFIDFVEINNLKWESETYSDFVNYRLIPALNHANKTNFIDFVTNNEYIPYFKNLLSSDLDFGKQESNQGNKCQPTDIQWKYELYITFDGDHKYYISTESYLTFSVGFNNGKFIISDNLSKSDYIAEDIPLQKIDDFCFSNGNRNYILKNISSINGIFGKKIYFEKITERGYRQTTILSEGHSYIVLAQEGIPREKQWIDSHKEITLAGYSTYEIVNYHVPQMQGNNNEQRRVTNTFELDNMGSWFSINLVESQKIYWKSDLLQENAAIQEVTNLRKGLNGKTYFRLPHTIQNQISGSLFISRGELNLQNELKTIDRVEHIVCNFNWNGNDSHYEQNGWGEVMPNQNENPNQNNYNVPRRIFDSNVISENRTESTDLLVQILYDIADKKGRIGQNKMVAALNFVLEFFNIVPTKKNRKNIIYALRRLGYIIAYFDGRTFQNQLIAPYIEKTGRTINGNCNAYVFKGIYEDSALKKVLEENTIQAVRYKRPYDKETEDFYPEYKCLPDMILFEDDRINPTFNGWKVQNYPIGFRLLDKMENMSDFGNHFGIENSGDIFATPQQYNPPCTTKNEYGEEILLTKRKDGQYIKHKTYVNNEGGTSTIPKQLSRAYCQNQKGLPVCMMESQKNGTIIYSKLTFAKGMAKPEILDTALCDFNLGLPHFERLFIVDVNDTQLPHHATTTTEGRTYSYNATPTDHKSLLSVLTKLGAEPIENIKNSPRIYHCRVQNQCYGYELFASINANEKPIWKLKYENDLVAFSNGNCVYYQSPGHPFREVNPFREEKGNSIKQKLSQIILSGDLNFGDAYNQDIPQVNEDTDTKIRIILRS